MKIKQLKHKISKAHTKKKTKNNNKILELGVHNLNELQKKNNYSNIYWVFVGYNCYNLYYISAKKHETSRRIEIFESRSI